MSITEDNILININLMRVRLQSENPFNFLGEDKWNQYRQREMNFSEMPIYQTINYEEIIELEKSIKSIGYSIIGRYTRNSCNIPADPLLSSIDNWRQQTDYICLNNNAYLLISLIEFSHEDKNRNHSVRNSFCVDFDSIVSRNFPDSDFLPGKIILKSSKAVKYYTTASLNILAEVLSKSFLEIFRYKCTKRIRTDSIFLLTLGEKGLFNRMFNHYFLHDIVLKINSGSFNKAIKSFHIYNLNEAMMDMRCFFNFIRRYDTIKLNHLYLEGHNNYPENFKYYCFIIIDIFNIFKFINVKERLEKIQKMLSLCE